MLEIPKFLLLQSESTLMTFPAKSELPFILYTTAVCNCLCVVIHSSSQGVAFMGHLDLANMEREDFDKYITTFNYMIRKHDLNSSNTEIALIGANRTDRTSNLVGFNQSTGALRFKEYFEKNFSSITEIIGGKSNIERNVELTPETIRVMEAEFTVERRILSYKEITINSSESLKNKTLLTLHQYLRGNLMQEMSAEKISELNLAIQDKALLQALNTKVNETIPKRCLFIGMASFDVRQLAGMSVSNLFPLMNDNKYSNVSAAIFNCAVRNPKLFEFIRTEIQWEHVRDFTYDQINRFGFAIVRNAITAKAVTVKQILEMPESRLDWLKTTDATESDNMDRFLSFFSGSDSANPLRLSIDTSSANMENMSPATSPRETKNQCTIC